jgi:aspartate racemase
MSEEAPPPRYLAAGQRFLPGILGGLGPLSHVQFEQQLLASRYRRGARNDQDHPVWLVASASSTPNRMASLSGEGTPALPYLAHYAGLLQAAGADILVVVCNTAHAYHQQVQRGLRIPWMHLMQITAAHIRGVLPGARRIGVLGTDGTLQTRLYHDALEREGLQAVAPALESSDQRSVMEAIFDPVWGIKATGTRVSPRARERLGVMARRVAGWGADAIIAGCTEVSVGLNPEDVPETPVVDPLAVAAELVLDVAYGDRQPAEFRIEAR